MPFQVNSGRCCAFLCRIQDLHGHVNSRGDNASLLPGFRGTAISVDARKMLQYPISGPASAKPGGSPGCPLHFMTPGRSQGSGQDKWRSALNQEDSKDSKKRERRNIPFDRRSGKDRRKAYKLGYFRKGGVERRSGKERRSGIERRSGWTEASDWTSVSSEGSENGKP